MQNLLARNLGAQTSGKQLKKWDAQAVDALELLPEQKIALKANLALMGCADAQVNGLEKEILQRAKLREDYQLLLSVSGIGKVLALTIALETGDVKRFAVQHDETVKRFYQKKCAKTLSVVAIKAVAHKLARACFHIMRHGVAFDVQRAFGPGAVH